MSAPKNYIDIGHTHDATLWIYRDGRILITTNDEGATRESEFGRRSLNEYRGRYEPSTKRLSIKPPYWSKEEGVPPGIIDRLEEIFGNDSEMWVFEHGKYGRRFECVSRA